MRGTAIGLLVDVAVKFKLNAVIHEGRDYSGVIVAAAMITFVTAIIIVLQVITKNNEFYQ